MYLHNIEANLKYMELIFDDNDSFEFDDINNDATISTMDELQLIINELLLNINPPSLPLPQNTNVNTTTPPPQTNNEELNTAIVMRDIFLFLNATSANYASTQQQHSSIQVDRNNEKDYQSDISNNNKCIAIGGGGHEILSKESNKRLQKNIAKLPFDIVINHILPYTYNVQPLRILKDVKNFWETKEILLHKICNHDTCIATQTILNVYSRSYIYNHANKHVINRINKWSEKHKEVWKLFRGNNETETVEGINNERFANLYVIHRPNILKLFQTPEKWIFLWAILPSFIRNRYLYILYVLLNTNT